MSGGPAVRVVRCLLQPGEDVELRAWFVPTVGQLANWFDAVEAAALLATHEGDPTSRLENGNACARGLQALIKKQVDGKQSDDDAAKKVCTSAGNLAIPSSETMRAGSSVSPCLSPTRRYPSGPSSGPGRKSVKSTSNRTAFSTGRRIERRRAVKPTSRAGRRLCRPGGQARLRCARREGGGRVGEPWVPPRLSRGAQI